MSAIKTIDVKGLEHGEREKLVFPSINGLKNGEILRISFEFNPLPLVYMLQAKGEFETSYEKESPEEWILNVKRVAGKGGEGEKKEQLKALLYELKGGDVSEETREKAKEFFQSVDAKTLGMVEQELIREGLSHDEVRKSLCDIHLEAMKEALVSKRIEVAAPHPVHTLMEEHKFIVDSLNKLGSFVAKLQEKDSLKDSESEELKDIAHHLVEAESHHQREEEVLFPLLEKHDIVEPPSIMKLDHVEFRKRKQELYKIAHNAEEYSFQDFKQRVIELGEYLSKELEGHIFKEDNILYQIALQVLTAEEWEAVKIGCDKIGYCCFTPEDQKKEAQVVELDLRPMPPFERHDKIFEIWDSLNPGQALRIINDHNPKPLHYQFEVEQKGKYEWAYEQQGPRDWQVKITRV